MPRPQPDTDFEIQTLKINPEDVQICPEFEKNPDTSKYPGQKIYDWGIIMLTLPETNRPGFGFNLRLAYQEFGKKEKKYDQAKHKVIEVSDAPQMRSTSFRFRDEPGKPLERSGELIVEGEERLREAQLEYDIDTEEGMSGSPVWMGSKGCECVVAIQ